MSMNLACCFIHAGYEYKSERDGAREREKMKRGGGEGRKVKGEEKSRWKRGKAAGKEKYEATESVIKTTVDLFTLCATHSN